MIEIKFSSLRETSFTEYAVRFLFGGACTVGAGLVAKRFGPAAGGLFLAFPAIFPAGASLVASHEKSGKQSLGSMALPVVGRLPASIRLERRLAALDSSSSRSFCGCVYLRKMPVG